MNFWTNFGKKTRRYMLNEALENVRGYLWSIFLRNRWRNSQMSQMTHRYTMYLLNPTSISKIARIYRESSSQETELNENLRSLSNTVWDSSRSSLFPTQIPSNISLEVSSSENYSGIHSDITPAFSLGFLHKFLLWYIQKFIPLGAQSEISSEIPSTRNFL